MTHWLKPAVLITNDFYSGLVTTWSETLQTLLCPARCQKNRIYAFVCAGTVLENTPNFFVVYQQTRSILFRMGY